MFNETGKMSRVREMRGGRSAVLTPTEQIVSIDTNNELTTFVTPDRSVNVHNPKLVTSVTNIRQSSERTTTQLTQLYVFNVIVIVVITRWSTSAATTGPWSATSDQRLHNPPLTPPGTLSVSRELAICSEIDVGSFTDDKILSLWREGAFGACSTTFWPNTVAYLCRWHDAICSLLYQQFTSHQCTDYQGLTVDISEKKPSCFQTMSLVNSSTHLHDKSNYIKLHRLYKLNLTHICAHTLSICYTKH